MSKDLKMFRWLVILIVLPIGLAIFGGERFRYPCQDPENWEKAICKKPICDVTRQCPEHIFKGQRDPRLGPNDESTNKNVAPIVSNQGVSCGK